MGRTRQNAELAAALNFCNNAMLNYQQSNNSNMNAFANSVTGVTPQLDFNLTNYHGSTNNGSFVINPMSIGTITNTHSTSNVNNSNTLAVYNNNQSIHETTVVNDIVDHNSTSVLLNQSLDISSNSSLQSSSSNADVNSTTESNVVQCNTLVTTNESSNNIINNNHIVVYNKLDNINNSDSSSQSTIDDDVYMLSKLQTSNKAVDNLSHSNHTNNVVCDNNEVVVYDKNNINSNTNNITFNETSIVATNQNVVVPSNKAIVSFSNVTNPLNRIIDNCINHEISIEERNILKQYLNSDFPLDFKIAGETIEQATNRCFKRGMFFYSIHHLNKVINLFGQVWGFKGSTYGKMVCCSRAFTPISKARKKQMEARNASQMYNPYADNNKTRNRSSFQCGCQWRIYASFLKSSATDVVRITTIKPKHTNTCEPSANQLVISRTKARYYSRLTHCKMRDIMNLLDKNPHIPSKIILPFLKEIIPGRKVLTSKDVVNARVHAKFLIKEIRKSGETIDNYEYKIHDVNSLTKSLDNCTDDILDDAVACIKQVYQECLNDDSSSIKMFAVLEKLSQIDKGFTYNIAFDNNNIATGVVWMTSTMRSNLLKFGSFICLDAMKRTTNVHAWPYIGPTIVNDINHISVVCESFCVSERIDAYKFILKSLFQMAPQFDKTLVKVIFADEFLNQTTLDDVGMSQTRLIYDHYHLHLNWLKTIGPLYTMMYRPTFTQILNADSEHRFNFLVQKARNEYKDNSTVLKELNDLVIKKNHCVSYVIDSIEGSYGKRGSTHAEQNHASIMAILGKDFVGQLEDLLKILLERQERLNKQYNTELSEAYHDMLILNEKLQSQNKHPILIDASKHLSKFSYERFEKAYQDSQHYYVEINDDLSFDIYRSKDQFKEPRHFDTVESKCNCSSSIAFQEQCVHEIKLLNKFDITKFSKRHIIRSGITLNNNKLGYKNPHCYQHLRIDEYPCSTVGIYDNEHDDQSQYDNETTTTLALTYDNVNTEIENFELVNNTSLPKVKSKQSLSFKEMADILSKIYSACSSNTKLHTVVGGFMLQMLSVVQHKECSKISNLNELETEFMKLIHNFNSSFNTIDTIDKTKAVCLGFPSAVPNTYHMSRKRCVSKAEQNSKKPPLAFRRVIKKQKSCSFCSEIGHQVSNCPRKESLGEVVDFDQLIYEMENTSPFCIATYNDKVMNNFVSKDVYHLSIAFLKCKIKPVTERPHPSKFLCNITCYNKIASIIPGYENVLVPLPDVIRHIRSVHHSKVKMVFSKINSNFGGDFHDFDRKHPMELLSPPFSFIRNNHKSQTQSTIETSNNNERIEYSQDSSTPKRRKVYSPEVDRLLKVAEKALEDDMTMNNQN